MSAWMISMLTGAGSTPVSAVVRVSAGASDARATAALVGCPSARRPRASASARTPASAWVGVLAAREGRSRHSWTAASCASSGASCVVPSTVTSSAVSSRSAAVVGWSRLSWSRWVPVSAISHGECGLVDQPDSSSAHRWAMPAARNSAPRSVTPHTSPSGPEVSTSGAGTGRPGPMRSAWRHSSSVPVTSSVVVSVALATRVTSRTPTPPPPSGRSGAVPSTVSRSVTCRSVSTARATPAPSARSVTGTGSGVVKSPPGSGVTRPAMTAPTRGDRRAVSASTRSSRPAAIIRASGRSGSSRDAECPIPPAVARVSSSRRCRSGSSARTPGRSTVGTGQR